MNLYRVHTEELVARTYHIRAESEGAARELFFSDSEHKVQLESLIEIQDCVVEPLDGRA